MRQKSIFLSAFLLLSLVLTYNNKTFLTQHITKMSTGIKETFLTQKDSLISLVKTHFNQQEQIKILEAKVKELEPKASLSVAFATKLNHLLKETNLSATTTNLHLVQTLGYVNMLDRNHLWLDFKGFQKGKTYGLIFQGYTAGIVRTKSTLPLAILQSSDEPLFSVFIGEACIPGVAYGDEHHIEIRYIPNYEKPKIGDEVLTSGNDKIFYEGIKVGKVISIQKHDMFTSVTLQPYANLKQAHFFYAVEVK